MEGDFGPPDGPEIDNIAAFRELLASFGLENTVHVARLARNEDAEKRKDGQRSEAVAFRSGSTASRLQAVPRQIGLSRFLNGFNSILLG